MTTSNVATKELSGLPKLLVFFTALPYDTSSTYPDVQPQHGIHAIRHDPQAAVCGMLAAQNVRERV